MERHFPPEYRAQMETLVEYLRRAYSDVAIEADDLIGNSRRLTEWSWADSLARLDEPVREWEWFMSPQTVNAYYSPTRNEVVFPAAILQPPFFDPFAESGRWASALWMP